LGLLGKEHLPLVSRVVELGRILGRHLRRGRVGGVGDRLRRHLDLGLDRRLLATFGGRRRLVGARPLHVVLLARAAAGRATSAAWTAALDGAETFAVSAAAAGLARGAQTLHRASAAAARLILVAEPGVLGHAFVALRHDLALVDPDLHANATEGRL